MKYTTCFKISHSLNLRPLIGLIFGLFLILAGCGLNLRGNNAEAPVTGAANMETPVEGADTTETTKTDTGEASEPPAAASETTVLADTKALREAVTVASLRQHLNQLQAIADANDGARASGTPGFDASATYVQEQLEAAGYVVTVQQFTFPFFYDATAVTQVTPTETPYTYFEDFATLAFSAGGEVTAPLQPVGIRPPLRGSASSGCTAGQFADFEPGNIALIKRGICTFAEKARNAEAAGASAVLVFNDAARRNRERVVFGTLGEPGINIPVVGLSFALGEALYQLSLTDDVILHVKANVISEERQTVNIIADTPGGRDDFVVVVGGHLDSVPAGPGIQDNGSGVAAILEIALQMAELKIEPLNKVRFAFWGAEEFGLLGSEHYVETLSRAERERIALNLNFDMIASPNYGRFVYDGDHSAFSAASLDAPAPDGSGAIEQVFHDYFEAQGLALSEIPFDGRSDYGPFIEARIPAGGLFTGAEEPKSTGMASRQGGAPAEAYDSCYHLPCDTIDNINWQAMDEMSDAAAHAVLIFAMTEEVE